MGEFLLGWLVKLISVPVKLMRPAVLFGVFLALLVVRYAPLKDLAEVQRDYAGWLLIAAITFGSIAASMCCPSIARAMSRWRKQRTAARRALERQCETMMALNELSPLEKQILASGHRNGGTFLRPVDFASQEAVRLLVTKGLVRECFMQSTYTIPAYVREGINVYLR